MLSQFRRRDLLIIGCFMVTFVVWAFAGTFSRYIADDYCTAARVVEHGYLGSISTWYYTWAGQYSNWTVKGVLHLVGVWINGVLPTLYLVGWFGLLTWALYPLARMLRLQRQLFFVVTMACIILYAVFAGTPSIIQSLYWMGASVPYTLPLLGMTFYLGYFARQLEREGRLPFTSYVITLLLTFLLAGFSEVYTVFQTAVFGLMIFSFFWVKGYPTARRKALILLGIALACSLIGMGLIIFAPGTAVRQAVFGGGLPVSEALGRAIYVSASYFASAIGFFAPMQIVATLILSGYCGYQAQSALRLKPKTVRQFLGLSLLGALALLTATIIPPVYATGVAPPARVYIMPHLILILATASWGVIMGISMPYRKSARSSSVMLGTIGLAVIMLIAPLLTSVQALGRIPAYRAYATEWDANAAKIQTADPNEAVNILVTARDLGEMSGLETFTNDSQFWINTCAASYYGVEGLIAHTPLEMGDKSK